MIYITGDTHGNYSRFDPTYFPAGRTLNREDYVIVCGDFGIWDETEVSNSSLDWLDGQPFTTLFIDGNHENFGFLHRCTQMQWHGGSVHRVREHILHLMRGQVFEIGRLTFFTMGGAASHDTSAGILEPNDPYFKQKKCMLDSRNAHYRINHISLWQEELLSEAEYETALRNLQKANWKVDCILTHCCPTSIAAKLSGRYTTDRLTEFLELVNDRCTFDYWLFGHYHDNRIIDERFILQWERMLRISL